MLTKPENIDISKKQICSDGHFIYVPLCRQETEYTCGIACVQSILKCYDIDYNQDVLAEALQSKPLLGTDPRNIISLMHQFGLQAYVFKNMNIDELKYLINKGITPLLLIQAWGDDNVDYTSNWRNRHYVIACGYTKNKIFFMDPYTLGNYTYLPNSELLKRWHTIDQSGDRYYNSGIIIKKKYSQLKYDPCIIKYMP